MYQPTAEPDLYAIEERDFEVRSAAKERSKGQRLTARVLAANSDLPAGTDHENGLAFYRAVQELPMQARVAIDTETSYRPDIKSNFPSQTAIRFVQMAHKGKAVCTRVTPENITLIQLALASILRDPNKTVLMHNAQFDLAIAHKFLGIDHIHTKARIIDTLLLSQFVYLGANPSFRHDLGSCLHRELGLELDKSAQASDWRLPVEQDRWEYINNDVLHLEALASKLYQRMRAESPALLAGWERERRYGTEVATALTITGFMVDVEAITGMLAETEQAIAIASTRLTELVGPDPAYSGLKADLEAKILKKQALIVKNGKRKPGVAEREIAANEAKLLALCPNFKYRSNKDKLALLQQMRPILLRLHYEQAMTLVAEDSALLLTAGDFAAATQRAVGDIQFFSAVASATHDDEDGTKDADIFATMELAIEDYTAAAQSIAKSVEDARRVCAQSPEKLKATLEAVAANFATTATETRCATSTATNWKLIKARLTAPVANLSEGEKVWIEVADTFLNLAKLSKKQSMLKAYLLLAELDPSSPRLHSAYRTLGAATSRTSSTGPNLQNVDRGATIRGLFKATPGYRLAVFDASQIELRVAFALANEQKGLQAFRDGKDLHTVTALLIWGKDIRDILVEHAIATAEELANPDFLYTQTYYYFDDNSDLSAEDKVIKGLIKQFRQLAKSANFGLLYGAGWRGLQGYIFSSSGMMVSEAEARDLRSKFFAAYPALAAWHEGISRHAMTNPLYISVSDDTRRLMPPSWDFGGYVPNRNIKLTVMANTPVQGLAAVILKNAVLAVYDKIKADPSYKGVRMIATVHDELVLELPDALDHQFLSRDILKTMTDASQHPMLAGKVHIEYAGGLCDKTNTWADK